MPTAILDHASNVLFQGGTNNFVVGNQVNHDPGSIPNIRGPHVEKQGMALLKDQCALDALVDSNERFDPPRCAEETRQNIIHDILTWVHHTDDKSASMLWVYGSAGAGKSAILQTVSELMKNEDRLLATFFFSRTAASANRSNGGRLIPTLAYQLAHEVPRARSRMEASLLKDPAIFERARSVQMKQLFTNILQDQTSGFWAMMKRLSKPFPKLKGKCLIVIDGLDECLHQEVQADLLKIIASTTSSLHLPIRFLISSRPESHIKRVFMHDNSFEGVQLHKVDLDQDSEASTGIRHYLERELEKIRTTHPLGPFLDPLWPSQEAIDTLVFKSSTQYVYAATVIKYLRSPQHRPDDRLLVILRLSPPPMKDRPFAQLDALYEFIFSCVDEVQRDTVWRLLGILFLAGQGEFTAPLTPSILEAMLSLRSGDVYLLLDSLASVIHCPTDRKAQIVVMHASLFDYLLDPLRSGNFTLDVRSAHESLALFYYRHMLDDLDIDAIPTTGYRGDLHESFLCLFRHSSQADPSRSLALMHALFSIPFERIFTKMRGMRLSAGIIVFVDELLDFFLREDFPDSQTWLAQYLQQIYRHVKTSLPSHRPIVERPFDPEARVFSESSIILNTANRIYATILNHEDERNVVYMGAPETILIDFSETSSRLCKHLLILSYPLLYHHLSGGSRTVLSTLSTMLKPSEAYCSGIDTELDKVFHDVVKYAIIADIGTRGIARTFANQLLRMWFGHTAETHLDSDVVLHVDPDPNA